MEMLKLDWSEIFSGDLTRESLFRSTDLIFDILTGSKLETKILGFKHVWVSDLSWFFCKLEEPWNLH